MSYEASSENWWDLKICSKSELPPIWVHVRVQHVYKTLGSQSLLKYIKVLCGFQYSNLDSIDDWIMMTLHKIWWETTSQKSNKLGQLALTQGCFWQSHSLKQPSRTSDISLSWSLVISNQLPLESIEHVYYFGSSQDLELLPAIRETNC